MKCYSCGTEKKDASGEYIGEYWVCSKDCKDMAQKRGFLNEI